MKKLQKLIVVSTVMFSGVQTSLNSTYAQGLLNNEVIAKDTIDSDFSTMSDVPIDIPTPDYRIHLITATTDQFIDPKVTPYDIKSFDDAKRVIKTLPESTTNSYVIKRVKFYQSNVPPYIEEGEAKIIYANHGMSIFEVTDSSSNETVNIYPQPSPNNALTYVSKSSQPDMAYIDTEISPLGTAWYKIKMSGVTGYISEVHFDGIGSNSTTVYTKNGIIPYSKIPEYSYLGLPSGKDATRWQMVNGKFSYTPLIGSKRTTTNLGMIDLPFSNPKTTPYYSYDGNYFYETMYAMLDDYKTGIKSFSRAINKDQPYYDYYMYLPMRSKTNIKESVFDQYLLSKRSDAGVTTIKTGNPINVCRGSYPNEPAPKTYYKGYTSQMYNRGIEFLSHQKESNINPGVVYGITALESGYGTSRYAYFFNNLWGYRAVDNCPDKAVSYRTISEGISDVFKSLYSSSYANPNRLGGYGTQLGNKQAGANLKYASDPNWGFKNAQNYRNLDAAANYVDKNYYRLGVTVSDKLTTETGKLDSEYVYFYSDTNLTNSVYYQDKSNSSVIIVSEGTNYYKVIDSRPNVDGSYTYGSYVYVAKSKIRVINSAPFRDPKDVNNDPVLPVTPPPTTPTPPPTTPTPPPTTPTPPPTTPTPPVVPEVVYPTTNITNSVVSNNNVTVKIVNTSKTNYTKTTTTKTKTNVMVSEIVEVYVNNIITAKTSNYYTSGKLSSNVKDTFVGGVITNRVTVVYDSLNRKVKSTNYTYVKGIKTTATATNYNTSGQTTYVLTYTYKDGVIKTGARRNGVYYNPTTKAIVKKDLAYYYDNGKWSSYQVDYYSAAKVYRTFKTTYFTSGKTETKTDTYFENGVKDTMVYRKYTSTGQQTTRLGYVYNDKGELKSNSYGTAYRNTTVFVGGKAQYTYRQKYNASGTLLATKTRIATKI